MADFRPGDQVAVFLWNDKGEHLAAITGTIKEDAGEVDIARPGQKARKKRLYLVHEIEGYRRPHEDAALAAAGQYEVVEEAHFCAEDMSLIGDDGMVLAPEGIIARRSLMMGGTNAN